MKTYEATAVLNRLLAVLCRGLPAYLADARPWTRFHRFRVQAAVDRLAADGRMYARRVSEAIVRLGGRPDPGGFPAEFSAKNDLAIDFLLREIIDDLEQNVTVLKRCAEELESDSSLHALAEEVLGNARGHLEVLKGMMNAEG
jgi:hypothetical protein